MKEELMLKEHKTLKMMLRARSSHPVQEREKWRVKKGK